MRKILVVVKFTMQVETVLQKPGVIEILFYSCEGYSVCFGILTPFLIVSIGIINVCDMGWTLPCTSLTLTVARSFSVESSKIRLSYA